MLADKEKYRVDKKGVLSISNEDGFNMKLDDYNVPLERLRSININLEAPHNNELILKYHLSDVEVEGIKIDIAKVLNGSD
ncbi:hypothetical protein [Vagococcus fluvialis]|nr:hypothetical protein [Vagococcus fluvialis]